MSLAAISFQKCMLSFAMSLLMLKIPLPVHTCLEVPGCECSRGPLYVDCNRQLDISPGTGVTLTVIPSVGDDIIYLSVMGHNIHRLNSSQLVYRSLIYLLLTDNRIEVVEDETFRHLGNLERLWLSSNRILVLGPSIFSGIPKLTMLTLDNNVNLQLERCSFSTLDRLRYLSLKNTAVDFNLNLFNSSKCLVGFIPKFYYLDITFSATRKIDAELLDPFQAKTLYIGNENVSTSYNALDRQSQVQSLYLCFIEDEFFNRTNISTFQSLTFLQLSDSLSYFPKDFLRSESLQTLYILRTGFRHLPANAFESIPNLKSLSVIGTSLNSINKAVFGGIPSVLRYMDFTNNNLSTLPKDSDIFSSPDLQTLYIGNTGFNIDLSVFQAVKSLESVSFYNFSATFFLGGSLGNMESLKRVYIYINPPFFPKQFLASNSVENLIISGSAMSFLPANAFDAMPRLKYLQITETKLKKIHRDTFNNTPSLDTIDLSDNLLETLPENLFDDKTKTSITLTGNPWKCDCNLLWFGTFFSGETDEIGFCHSPPHMQGIDLSNANLSDFVCPTTDYLDLSQFEIPSSNASITSDNTTSVITKITHQMQTVSKETELPKGKHNYMNTFFKYVSGTAMVSLLSLTFLVCGVVLVARCKQFRFKFNIEQNHLDEKSCQNLDENRVVEKYSEINSCDDMTPSDTKL